MKFIIRADGGKKTGMGHIMRSSVLAEALRKYGELSYVCLNGEEYQAGRQYLKENSFDVLSFSEEELLNRLQDIDYDCIIVDDYKVDKTFFEGIKKKNALVGYFDDNKVEEYPVDFIINQNPYAEDLGYDKVRYLKTFLGSQYALLRKEFRNLPPFFAREEIKDLLITVGGSDINKVSERIVIQLLDAIPETMLHVVIGPAFPKGIMEDICSPRLKKYYNPKMSELMLNCDLAVSSSGSTLYELAACGTPAIGIVLAENQLRSAKKLKELGIIESTEIENIPETIAKLTYERRAEMSSKGRQLVDALGAERLAKELIALIKTSRSV